MYIGAVSKAVVNSVVVVVVVVVLVVDDVADIHCVEPIERSDDKEADANELWCRTIKNLDVSLVGTLVVHSHRSLIHSLCIARMRMLASALHCAHGYAGSLTHSLPSLHEMNTGTLGCSEP